MSNLKEQFDQAERFREQFLRTGSQETLEKTIVSYTHAQETTRRVALFSNNESVEDLVSSELRYFLTDYHLANLLLQRHDMINRLQLLEQSSVYYKSFLRLCEDYGLVLPDDKAAVETFLSSENGHASPRTSPTNASRARENKILRYQKDKRLRNTLNTLAKIDSLHDDRLRAIGLTTIHLAISNSVQELESIDLEIEVLNAINMEGRTAVRPQDSLERSRLQDDSWRLDRPRSEVLDRNGKVLKPFIITSKRDDLRRNVYGPDHSLPTMSVDEYLELERARGGILASEPPQDQGQSEGISTNEDDEKSEEILRRKAIEWDSFTEENAKGIGNTMNRG